MKPGDRIALLKSLATRLADMDWGELDLTLRQFRLPWSETWQGSDKYGYALSHLEAGPDDSLLALYEHLYSGNRFLGIPSISTEGNWYPNRFRLFLSYVSEYNKFISEIKTHLMKFAIDAFLAHEDIEPTKEWEKEIELALETCHALAAFLTPDFHISNWTDQEIGYCLKRRVLIIPVRLGSDPYGFLSRYQGLQGSGRSPEKIAQMIFDILVSHDLTAGQMADALVSQLEDSPSFADAKYNISLVERVNSWTPDLLRRLEASVQRNNQIRNAFGIPERIRSLIIDQTPPPF